MNKAFQHKRISELLSGQHTLAKYLKISESFEYLRGRVTNYLPEEIRPHVSIRYYREGELCLNVTSAAVGMRVKMAVPELIVRLSSEPGFRKLIRISTRVQPNETHEKARKRERVFQLSEENRQLMKSLAGETKDEELRQTLLKLADPSQSGCE